MPNQAFEGFGGTPRCTAPKLLEREVRGTLPSPALSPALVVRFTPVVIPRRSTLCCGMVEGWPSAPCILSGDAISLWKIDPGIPGAEEHREQRAESENERGFIHGARFTRRGTLIGPSVQSWFFSCQAHRALATLPPDERMNCSPQALQMVQGIQCGTASTTLDLII